MINSQLPKLMRNLLNKASYVPSFSTENKIDKIEYSVCISHMGYVSPGEKQEQIQEVRRDCIKNTIFFSMTIQQIGCVIVFFVIFREN